MSEVFWYLSLFLIGILLTVFVESKKMNNNNNNKRQQLEEEEQNDRAWELFNNNNKKKDYTGMADMFAPPSPSVVKKKPKKIVDLIEQEEEEQKVKFQSKPSSSMPPSLVTPNRKSSSSLSIRDREGWSVTEFLDREQNEVDYDEIPYTFMQTEDNEKNLKPESGSRVSFVENTHKYYVNNKDGNAVVRVKLSASKLWEYYNTGVIKEGGFGSHPTYVKNISENLANAVVFYLVEFYKRMALTGNKRILTHNERIKLFEELKRANPQVSKQFNDKLKPFEVIGGGFYDVMERWLLLPNCDQIDPFGEHEDEPLHVQHFYFLMHFSLSEEMKRYALSGCIPLANLITIKNAACMIYRDMQQMSGDGDKQSVPVDVFSAANHFASTPREAGTEWHAYVEYKIKNIPYQRNLLIGKEDIGNADYMITQLIQSERIGIYRKDLSEVAFVTFKYMISGKSDGVFQLPSGDFMLIDLKRAKGLIDELVRRGVQIIDNKAVLANMTIPKSSDLWKYCFQLGTYRKIKKLNKVGNVLPVALLIVQYPTRIGYVEIECHLDSINTSLDTKAGLPEYSVLEHVDRAFQYRLKKLEQAQLLYEQTGNYIDENCFYSEEVVD